MLCPLSEAPLGTVLEWMWLETELGTEIYIRYQAKLQTQENFQELKMLAKIVELKFTCCNHEGDWPQPNAIKHHVGQEAKDGNVGSPGVGWEEPQCHHQYTLTQGTHHHGGQQQNPPPAVSEYGIEGSRSCRSGHDVLKAPFFLRWEVSDVYNNVDDYVACCP